jgi:hypothetical protein
MKYNMLFSDISFGHPDFGYIPRKDREDPDDEDTRYGKYLIDKGYNVSKVCDGRFEIL